LGIARAVVAHHGRERAVRARTGGGTRGAGLARVRRLGTRGMRCAAAGRGAGFRRFRRSGRHRALLLKVGTIARASRAARPAPWLAESALSVRGRSGEGKSPRPITPVRMDARPAPAYAAAAAPPPDESHGRAHARTPDGREGTSLRLRRQLE